MIAPKYPIAFDEGADLDLQFLWKDAGDDPVDLTGYTARMMIKEKIDGVIIKDWQSYLSLNTPMGAVNLNVPAINTVDIGFTSGVYDIELISPTGKVYKYIKGTVQIFEEVTN